MAALSSPAPPSTTAESASPSRPLPPASPPFFPSTLQSPAMDSFSKYNIPSSSTTTPPTQCFSTVSSNSSKPRSEKVKQPECNELAGRTTAECLAILCCCPLCVIDFAILTTCKLPLGLCRKALWKRRLSRKRSDKNKPNAKKAKVKKKKKKKEKKKNSENETKDGDVKKKDGVDVDIEEDDFFCIEFPDPRIVVHQHQAVDAAKAVVASSFCPGFQPSPEMKEMDEQMRNMFFSTGFFRSMSNSKIQIMENDKE